MSLAPVITQPPSRWKRHHATACAPSATVVHPAATLLLSSEYCFPLADLLNLNCAAPRWQHVDSRPWQRLDTCSSPTLPMYSQRCLFVSGVGKWGTRGDVVSCLRRQPRECDKCCSSVRNFIVDIASRHSGNTPRWEGYPRCYYSLGGKHTQPRKSRNPHAASFCLRSCNLSRRQHM
jgi:hypothetical protein